MRQVWFGHEQTSALSRTATQYGPVVGGLNPRSTNELLARLIIPTDGFISSLLVELTDGISNPSAPGDGRSWAFTLMVDGVASDLVVTVANTDTQGENKIDRIPVLKGQTVSIRNIPTANPFPGVFGRTSLVFDGSVEKTSVIMGGTRTNVVSKVGNSFGALSIGNGGFAPITVEVDVEQIIAAPGIIHSLFVEQSFDPGIAPDAYRYTVRKNGVSTILTGTITADDLTVSDLVNSFIVVAGDRVAMFVEALNTPDVANAVRWSVAFVASRDGESLVMGSTTDNPSTTSLEYIEPWCSTTSPWGTSSAFSRVSMLAQQCALKDLHIDLLTAPGSGRSYTFSTTVDAAERQLEVVISGGSLTGNDTQGLDILDHRSRVALTCEPSGTPDATQVRWGYVQVPAPCLRVCISLEHEYSSFFEKSTVPLQFDLKADSWKQIIDTSAIVLPTAGLTGLAINLNTIQFIIEVTGLIYGPHILHPDPVHHNPDLQDMEELALMINRGGLTNKAVLTVPTIVGNVPTDRDYAGVLKSMSISEEGGVAVPSFSLQFQVLWTVSHPTWRGWATAP